MGLRHRQAIASLADLSTRRHDQLQELTDDDHLLYARTLVSNAGLLNVSNTAAETDLVSETITGGLVTVFDVLRLRAWGYILNNTLAAQTVTLRLRHPTGTILIASPAESFAQSASRRMWYAEAYIGYNAVGVPGSVFAHLLWVVGVVGTAAAAPVTMGAAAISDYGELQEVSFVDTSVNQLLRLTVQLGVADVNLAMQRHGMHLAFYR